jgi:hypothetical protein
LLFLFPVIFCTISNCRHSPSLFSQVIHNLPWIYSYYSATSNALALGHQRQSIWGTSQLYKISGMRAVIGCKHLIMRL